MSEQSQPHNKGSQPTNPTPFERSTLRWTKATFFILGVTCIFIAFQWNEMRSGGRDTHDLAVAAKAQADQATAQTQKMAESLTKTDSLIKATTAQVKAANDLASEAKRAADLSKQTVDAESARFIDDQRPYLWVNKTDAPLLQAGHKAIWSFEYTNYGRSPAIGVVLRAQTIFGSGSRARIRNDLYNPIHPNVSDRTGSVMPPQYIGYSSAFSVETLTIEDVKEIPLHDDGIALLAYFEYFDIRGNLYQTRFCIFRFANGAFCACPGETRNGIK